jgi:GrpB-like predicted nucleotidyltransferase (UPF0157 family)
VAADVRDLAGPHLGDSPGHCSFSGARWQHVGSRARGKALPAHHLYACWQGSAALANHLTVRDCLRGNPAAAAAYGQLKKQLAEQFPTDIESYIAGKTDFLLEVLRSAGFPNAVLLTIRDANRSK